MKKSLSFGAVPRRIETGCIIIIASTGKLANPASSSLCVLNCLKTSLWPSGRAKSIESPHASHSYFVVEGIGRRLDIVLRLPVRNSEINITCCRDFEVALLATAPIWIELVYG